MAEFDSAVQLVLDNEKGYVDDPKDEGGATNFGISLRLLRSLSADSLRAASIFCEEVTKQTIIDLTLDQAKWIYRHLFWNVAPFEKITSPMLADYIFDMAVLHGVAQGVKIAQRALWAVYKTPHAVTDDGILGDHTILLLNSSGVMGNLILTAMMAERAGYMRLLCAQRSNDKEFLNGWLNRAYRS